MSCEGCEEGAYVIDVLAKLLAEIAIIVNGPPPPLTRWSYHDLPEKVRALKQAQQPAALAVPEGYALVPVEPTQAMRDAFRAELGSATYFTHTTLQCADFDSRYRAMLAIAAMGETP